MRRLLGLAFVVSTLAVLFGTHPADALSITKAYKTIVVTFSVTPSPTPVAAAPVRAPYRVASAADGIVSDVPPAPFVVAQATPQGNTPVTFYAKPDPNAVYLHFVPHNLSLAAGYGTNTYTCAFEIYTSYSAAYYLDDVGQGTVASGSGTFPVENSPTASYLSWLAEGVTTSFQRYANAGSPGLTTWTGAAGVAQQHCIDLQLVVPATQPAGTYVAALQYTLIYTF